MNIRDDTLEAGVARPGERGSTTLIVLVLLLAMTALAVSNSTTLYWLKRELSVIDQKQQKRFQPARPAEQKSEQRDAK